MPDQPPVAADDAATTTEDVSVTIDVLANDSDEDLAQATLAITQQPAEGAAAVEGRLVRFTPAPDATANQRFTYEVCDTGGQCATAEVTVSIDPVNDAPVAIPDSGETTLGTPISIRVIDNDVDVDGDVLRISSFDATSALGGSVGCTSNGNKECAYEPPASWDGTPDSFGYVVDDGNGGTAAAVVTITLAP